MDRKPVNQLPVYLSPAEVHQMIAVCENDRDKMFIKLLFASGCRVSEAINIRVGDLTKQGIRSRNLKQGFWRKLPDGGREHIAVPTEKHIFLPPDLLADLLQYSAGKAPEDFIIGRLDNGKRITRKTGWLIVTTAAMKAGVFRRRFSTGELRAAWTHTMRHSNAIHLLMEGAPITLVQQQLGHSSLSSTQVYTRLVNKDVEKFISGVTF